MAYSDDAAEEKQPVALLAFNERYIRAEWYTVHGDAYREHYFYTSIGIELVLDLVRGWMTKDTTFVVTREP